MDNSILLDCPCREVFLFQNVLVSLYTHTRTNTHMHTQLPYISQQLSWWALWAGSRPRSTGQCARPQSTPSAQSASCSWWAAAAAETQEAREDDETFHRGGGENEATILF